MHSAVDDELPKVPLLTPTPISPLFIMEMPGRKDARTPEKLRTCVASNLFKNLKSEAVLFLVEILSKILTCLFDFLILQEPCQKRKNEIRYAISICCVPGLARALPILDKICHISTQNGP
jgi:hypothetical protein